MPEAILTTSNLVKHYGKIHAVDGISLTIPQGSVYGILGPNGSGKTTTLGMVLDIIRPTSGAFQWFDEKVPKLALRRIGAILEHPNFYPYLSGLANLKIVADIKKIGYAKIPEVLELVNLTERGKSAFKTYSLGMKQRLAIAAAMLNNPEVLVLDEPTNGLDPQGIAEVRQLIRQIAAEGTTILLASHLLDEVEKVCSDVAVLKKGKLLFNGKVSELASDGASEWLEVAAEDMEKLRTVLAGLTGFERTEDHEGLIRAFFSDKISPAALNQAIMDQGVVVSHLALRKQNLESLFLALTQS
ncbi:MAG: ATP-binding cassette domain-containing protein [Bacteroidota bacterium]